MTLEVTLDNCEEENKSLWKKTNILFTGTAEAIFKIIDAKYYDVNIWRLHKSLQQLKTGFKQKIKGIRIQSKYKT